MPTTTPLTLTFTGFPSATALTVTIDPGCDLVWTLDLWRVPFNLFSQDVPISQLQINPQRMQIVLTADVQPSQSPQMRLSVCVSGTAQTLEANLNVPPGVTMNVQSPAGNTSWTMGKV